MKWHSHQKAAVPSKPVLAINLLDEKTHSPELTDAILIHNQTCEAIRSFHELFLSIHKPEQGSASHREQDLLRAMLLFACSGLDAVVKQLVNDALQSVLDHDEGAQREFQKFAERRLKKPPSVEDRERAPSSQPTDVGFLAELLVSFDPRSVLINALQRALVSDSLQSRDQLLRVAAHFALTKDDVMADDKTTKEAFDARNQITHEMDIDLTSGKGPRERDYATMVRWCENISAVSRCFIERTTEKIRREGTAAGK